MTSLNSASISSLILSTGIFHIRQVWLRVFICLYLLSFLFGCQETTDVNENEIDTLAKQTYQEDRVEVDTVGIYIGTFFKEIISSGKLKAKQASKLQFKADDEIQEVRVRNGQYVKKGDTLAILEFFPKQNALDQAELARVKADLEMKDALITFGFSWEDSVVIPTNIMKMARAKSGLEKAEADLKMARYALSQCWLIAPYSGVIANLDAKPFNMASDFKPFCTLYDVGRLEVSFQILEDELNSIERNQLIEVIPFSSSKDSYSGRVQSINPEVDSNGMIQIIAVLNRFDKKLIPGMNVKVLLKEKVSNQLIVPKSAVVLRQGREVIFTYNNDTAYWNYVKIGLENSQEYTIEDGLEPDVVLITEGNLNLAHKAAVSIP